MLHACVVVLGMLLGFHHCYVVLATGIAFLLKQRMLFDSINAIDVGNHYETYLDTRR